MSIALYGMKFNINVQTIAVMKTGEDYNNLAESFKDVFKAINYLIEHPIVEVNGQLYTVLCSDYKVCIE